jgi:hypothetical protein
VKEGINVVFAHERNIVSHMPMNMTAAQTAAFKTLQEDKDIIIKPADKNLGLCIVDKSWYISECDKILACRDTYQEIMEDPEHIVDSVERKINIIIDRYTHMNLLDWDIRKYLEKTMERNRNLPYMYLVPKVHKVLSPGDMLQARTITPAHSWITAAASKYMAHILNAVLKKHKQLLQDSTELIKEVDGMLVKRDSWLVTFDVSNLFPNVETAEAIDICANEVGGGKGEMVRDFLGVIMRNNYFNCIGKIWKMSEYGTAQGTPCSPPYANLYLAHLEKELYNSAPQLWPILFRRFLDDGFAIFQSLEMATQWTMKYDSLRPKIKLKVEKSLEKVNYLDLVIIKDMRIDGD